MGDVETRVATLDNYIAAAMFGLDLRNTALGKNALRRPLLVMPSAHSAAEGFTSRLVGWRPMHHSRRFLSAEGNEAGVDSITSVNSNDGLVRELKSTRTAQEVILVGTAH